MIRLARRWLATLFHRHDWVQLHSSKWTLTIQGYTTEHWCVLERCYCGKERAYLIIGRNKRDPVDPLLYRLECVKNGEQILSDEVLRS